MADEKRTLGNDWENSIFRRAIVETGDPEALRMFDEEQERMKKVAEEETKQMIKDGIIKV